MYVLYISLYYKSVLFTSSIVGMESVAPMRDTVIADALAHIFRMSGTDMPARMPAIK